MNEPPSRFLVSWESIHDHSRKLAHQVSASRTFDGIVAITRGGLVPAAIIAAELNIRLIETYCISSYVDQSQGDIATLKAPQITKTGISWLFIDDLVDSGKTAQHIKKAYPDSYLAVLYAKPAGKALADNYVIDIPQDTWIDFPWEKNNSPKES